MNDIGLRGVQYRHDYHPQPIHYVFERARRPGCSDTKRRILKA